MHKATLTIILILLCVSKGMRGQTRMPIHAFAVECRVFGVDEFDTVPYPLSNASVELIFAGDSTLNKVGYTGRDGRFNDYITSYKRLKDLRVRARFSYVGMATKEMELKFKQTNSFFNVNLCDIDTVLLISNPVTVEEVTIIGELRKMYEEGDTTVFNVQAFEMPSGSVLLELVRRLPGLLYENGRLTYKGQDIKEMRLNGESFFKNDISIALENMPNERLKQLKVYETPDDTLSMFSDKHLVMDMITDKPVNKTLFANASVSAKADPFNYMARANMSNFKMSGPQYHLDGTFGTLQQPPNKENDYRERTLHGMYSNRFKGMSFNVAPNLDRHDNRRTDYMLSQQNLDGRSLVTEDLTQSHTSRWGFDTMLPFTLQGQLGKSWTARTSLKLTYEHGSDKQSRSQTTSEDTGDGLSGERIALNKSESGSFYKDIRRVIEWTGGLTKRIGQSEMGGNLSFTSGHADNYMDDRTRIEYAMLSDSTTVYERHTENSLERVAYTASLFFKHRFMNSHSWGVNYTLSGEHTDTDYDYFNIPSAADPALTGPHEAMARVDSLSYDARSHQHSHMLLADLQLQWARISATFNVGTTPVHLRLRQEDTQLTRNEWLHQGNAKLTYRNVGTTLELGYSLTQQMPATAQLISVNNFENPLNTTTGNGSLKKKTLHHVNFRMGLPWGLGIGNQTSFFQNDFGRSTVFDPQTGRRNTTMKNVDGNWMNESNIGWNGMIGNTTARLTTTYRHSRNQQEIASGKGGYSTVRTYDNVIGVRTQVNYGNKWMTTGLMGQYRHIMRNRVVASGHSHRNELSISSNSSFQTPFGMTFLPDITYNLRGGYESEVMNRGELVCNLGVAYSFWKRIISLRLDFKDIFNKSRNVWGINEDNVWTERRNYFENQYVLLTVSVKLNEFR